MYKCVKRYWPKEGIRMEKNTKLTVDDVKDVVKNIEQLRTEVLRAKDETIEVLKENLALIKENKALKDVLEEHIDKKSN